MVKPPDSLNYPDLDKDSGRWLYLLLAVAFGLGFWLGAVTMVVTAHVAHH